jgi:hypothetical protein
MFPCSTCLILYPPVVDALQMIRRELRDGRLDYRGFVRVIVEAARVPEKRNFLTGIIRGESYVAPSAFSLQLVSTCGTMLCRALEEEEARGVGVSVGSSLFTLANVAAPFGSPAENTIARSVLRPVLDTLARRLDALISVRPVPRFVFASFCTSASMWCTPFFAIGPMLCCLLCALDRDDKRGLMTAGGSAFLSLAMPIASCRCTRAPCAHLMRILWISL